MEAGDLDGVVALRRDDVVFQVVFQAPPWLIGATLLAAVVARVAAGNWRPNRRRRAAGDAGGVPLLRVDHPRVHPALATKTLGRLRVDPLFAREHRAHHQDPRDVPLVFIPWKSPLLWVLPVTVAVGLVAFPRLGMGLT